MMSFGVDIGAEVLAESRSADAEDAEKLCLLRLAKVGVDDDDRLPASANVMPRFETVADFPSLARGLVNRIVLIFPGGEETSRVVLIDR